MQRSKEKLLLLSRIPVSISIHVGGESFKIPVRIEVTFSGVIPPA